MAHRIAWALCGLLAATAVHSAEVYRWTDAEGRVHYGDRAPEGRRASAKTLAIDPPPPIRAKSTTPAPPTRRPPSAGATAPAPYSPPLVGRPQALPPLEDKDTRCAAAWKRFDESSACFAPYRVDGGKVLAEAYDRCESVEMPADCGPHPGP